jgi:iron complex outermembrane receptor protein
MFKRTKVCTATLLALGGMLSLATAPVFGQQTLERVEITGSSIKRVGAEGALPVQTIRKADIQRSGVTSVVELMAKLSVVQGGVTEGDAIGGGGGGVAEVSIHGLDGDRTLVLLNGRRLVGEAGGATDLNMIPLAAIERVEILTDGASAIYGSDAVAGVVNFITARNSQAGALDLGVSIPEESGGQEANFSIAKGFGNLDTDGFNVMLTGSYDKRKALYANQRDFSKTGLINFQNNGKNYLFFNGSPRSIPGNIAMPDGSFQNPYEIENGVCPPQHVDVEGDCYFDFASTVMAHPDRERINLMATSAFKVNADHMLKFDAYYSRTESSGEIAATPGELSIDPNGPLGSYLDAAGWNPADGNATVYYRAMDLGGRNSTYKRNSYGLWFGGEGRVAGWDYNSSIGYQRTHQKEYNTGYPFGIAFNDLMASGLWNPFVLPGNQSQAALDAAAAIMTDGYYDGEKSELISVDGKISREIFSLPGGNAALAIGISYNEDRVETFPSDTAMGLGGPNGNDARFGDASAAIPYSAKRQALGVFGELIAPVTKELELTGALRYDDYKDIASAVNGKVGFRFQPNSSMVFRGSLGTGFRAPTLRQLYRPLQTFGVTEDNFDCTPEMAAIAASLGAICRPPDTQYDVKTGGVANIQPEESRQASIGFRLEPTANFSFGADWWWIGIDKTFGSVDEQEAFANAATYSNLWTTYTDPVTGNTYLAFNSSTTNLGKQYMSGIDFDITGRMDTALGALQSNFRATVMLRDDRQLLPGGAYYSPLGRNDASLAEVTFEYKGVWSNTMRTGNWQNTLNINFLSGYDDYPTDVYEVDDTGAIIGADNVTLKVKPYFTFDWQTAYSFNKNLTLAFGIKNLFDSDPPLSLRTSGGHMLGFDYRYYNPLGRTFQAKMNFAF